MEMKFLAVVTTPTDIYHSAMSPLNFLADGTEI